MSNNKQTQKSFVESFKGVSKNLAVRYSINMHLDFIQEFIKFADNTRDLGLQESILSQIQLAESAIISIINNYENEIRNKEDID